MESFTPREQITEVVNKLFVYTDDRQWQKLRDEVFTPEVLFDMSSMGAGEPRMLQSTEICEVWSAGFENIDVVNHLSGNHLISIQGDRANAFAYATATHYRENALQGSTRSYTGTYNLHFVQTSKGWRIDSFRYNLKYAMGNLTLE